MRDGGVHWMVVVLLLAGCATTRGGSPEPPPAPVTTGYDVLSDQRYVPADWPEPLNADVYVPRGEGPFPGVVLVHGGAWVAGLRVEMTHLARLLAARGYVAINIDYRTAPQYRHPAPLEDLREALKWSSANASRFKLDPGRFGAWGYSAGAQMVTLLATASTPADGLRLRAVVAGGLPADLRDQARNPFLQDYFGASRDEAPERYAEASPIVHVTPDDPPMFLYHGTWDRVVHTDNSRRMHEALDVAGVPNELRLVRAFGHLATFAFDPFTRNAAIGFLDRWLRD